MKGSQVKTNATMIVPPPNVKCSILFTVATTLTVLNRCFKQCSQQQPYVVLQQMYWISETRNILIQIKNTSKIHHVKYIYDDTKNKYHMWQFSEIVQGRKYEIKAYPIQLHLLVKKMSRFDVGDSFGTIHTQSKNEIDIPCTVKACILNLNS